MARKTLKQIRAILQKKGYRPIQSNAWVCFLYDPGHTHDTLDELQSALEEIDNGSFYLIHAVSLDQLLDCELDLFYTEAELDAEPKVPKAPNFEYWGYPEDAHVDSEELAVVFIPKTGGVFKHLG